jgi:protease-4
MQKDGMKKFFSTLFFPLTATLEFLQKYAKGILLLLLLLILIGLGEGEKIKKPNLIAIRLEGTIFDAQKVLEQIEEASKKQYKGALFVVDSPGGAVAPSLEISHAIKRLRQKKPVVTYAAGTLASGSYYAAIWSNKIYANPGSIVGSIGVIFQTPVVEELMDKVGVDQETVKAGRYKEVGTPWRHWKEYERKEIKKVIYDTYDMFVQDVCTARKLDCNESEKFADAHIFTARQAKVVGLVDEVATIDEAKKAVEKLSKVKKPVWKKPSKLEKLIDRLADKSASKLASLLWGMKLF